VTLTDPDALPAPLVVAGARERIRAARRATGHRIVVLDDDPTGSQSVHDVEVVTVLDRAEYASAMTEPGSTCFVLTNSRSLAEDDAADLTRHVATDVLDIANDLGAPVDVVSRSDSTLRGHLLAEIAAIEAARRARTGRGHDGVLLVPAFLEAGRFTAGDTHYAVVGGTPVPVASTEFARDAAFGYSTSDLRELLAERSGGALRVEDVHSIGLDDIRVGGPDRVAEILDGVRDGAWVVVNATDYADLEVVVLGLLEVESRGRTFAHRCGPSFVRALAGLEPQPPLTPADVWPDGFPVGRHGLLVVGSHVGLTSTQVEAARAARAFETVELSVPALVDEAQRDAHVASAASRVVAALASSDVLLLTSRELVRTEGAEANLRISRTVSTAVTDVVRLALEARPAWVVAKGGITSHDVAVRGLGIRRATVLGQLLPGMVSVLRPVEAAEGAVGVPYVVFAGNVGDGGTLAHVVDVVGGGGAQVDEANGTGGA
jgi:uncharacterized protein YgbK (DUF1537 family)